MVPEEKARPPERTGEHAPGYKGCYTFEWEKLWHPDLEEPEIAFADFAEFMRAFAPTGSFASRTPR
jgi:hypothetical protein